MRDSRSQADDEDFISADPSVAGGEIRPRGLRPAGHRRLSVASRVRLQVADFDAGTVAVASVIGRVRGHTEENDVSAPMLAHHSGMAERAIEAMIAEAEARFAVPGALVIHRVGRLLPGERIVLAARMSPHRRDAFQACEFLMDYLEAQAPFWEEGGDAAGGTVGGCASSGRCGGAAVGSGVDECGGG